MTKSTAAKTPKLSPVQYLNGGCVKCGHPMTAHDVDDVCPALPPAKGRVTVDEAVAVKTDFERSLAESGALVDDKAERKKLALVNFNKHPGEPMTLDIAIENLRPMRDNPRGEEMGDVSGLVKSMEMHGFIGSLFVRPLEPMDGDEQEYEVWAGNRRLKAAKEAGLEVLPCDVYEMTEVQALELNMAEQINRADLTPLQEGDACRRLMELSGYTEHQVAEKFGKSASWVTKRVALCGIAPELRKALTKGTLPVTLANALASLPSHRQQVAAAEALEARPDWEKRNSTAESDAEWIRDTQCRPLADANFKLTDADLDPSAGACSTCPHNSANAKMPGLFDNAKAKPTCAKVECFNEKELLAWLKRTEKLKAGGAKVLSLNECKKLFARGNDLGSGSRYVEAETKPPKDKQERTWGELVADVPEEHRPQLHVAQDNGGKLRQLYVFDKAMEAAAVHLKLRWAKAVVEEAQESRTASTPEARAKQAAENAEKHLISRVRDEVQKAVLDGVMMQLAEKFTLPAARFVAGDVGERMLERFGVLSGKKKLPKDWLEKGATFDQLLALVWRKEAADAWDSYLGFGDDFLAVAKAHGFKVEEMVKAQLATARAEAEKAAKS